MKNVKIKAQCRVCGSYKVTTTVDKLTVGLKPEEAVCMGCKVKKMYAVVTESGNEYIIQDCRL